MSDHADHAAATAAGWVRVQYDRGASASPRFISRYEKQIGNIGNRSSAVDSHQGESNASQAAADTAALAALNGVRQKRYGVGSNAGTDGRGAALTFDS